MQPRDPTSVGNELAAMLIGAADELDRWVSESAPGEAASG
jgi:hypothetical protein